MYDMCEKEVDHPIMLQRVDTGTVTRYYLNSKNKYDVNITWVLSYLKIRIQDNPMVLSGIAPAKASIKHGKKDSRSIILAKEQAARSLCSASCSAHIRGSSRDFVQTGPLEFVVHMPYSWNLP